MTRFNVMPDGYEDDYKPKNAEGQSKLIIQIAIGVFLGIYLSIGVAILFDLGD